MRSGAPPDWLRKLNRRGHQGVKGRGDTPHLAAHSYGAQPGVGGGPPNTEVCAQSAQPQDGGGGGTPHPAVHPNRVRAGEQGGHPNQSARYPSAHPGILGGGYPPELQRVHHACAGGHPNQAAR